MILPPESTSRLYLLRHAEAAWPQQGQTDHQRPLTPQGAAAAHRMGAWMARQDIRPDCILVSSAARTRATLEHMLAGGMAPVAHTETSDGLYLCGHEGLAEQIEEHGGQHRCVLVINHNPDVPYLAEWLCRPNVTDPTILGALHDFSPCSLAVIDGGAWGRLHAGWGHLLSVIRNV